MKHTLIGSFCIKVHLNQDNCAMKTFRGFKVKPSVGLGLQNHFQRKNTHEPARHSDQKLDLE